jgi:uncharacterized YigZ family protein
MIRILPGRAMIRSAMSKTPTQAHHLEQHIRRSRFVATVVALPTAADSDALLAELHDNSASHHCWAWKVADQYRSEDDGEPGGTAGRPILAAIEAQQFDHTLVLVQRWFGGIKLGTGGLARAYGGSAAKCLQQTPATELIKNTQLRIACAHEHIAVVHDSCSKDLASILEQVWQPQQVLLEVQLPVTNVAQLQQHLQDSSAGQISVQPLACDNTAEDQLSPQIS